MLTLPVFMFVIQLIVVALVISLLFVMRRHMKAHAATARLMASIAGLLKTYEDYWKARIRKNGQDS